MPSQLRTIDLWLRARPPRGAIPNRLIVMRSDSESTPLPRQFSMWGQLLLRAPRYGLGTALLLAYQVGQYWFDTRLAQAIDSARASDFARAKQLAIALMLVAVVAFFVRVWSRLVIFFAGRDAEYALRKLFLAHLYRLGPTFYTKYSAGELMSRATNDLTQVRLLLGFGVLNVINTVLALVSALTVMFSISVPLTLASMVTLPMLVLVTRGFAKRIFQRTRDNQESLGRLSDVVQTSISAMRVVRAFGLEAKEVERFEVQNHDVLTRGLALAKLRGLLGPMMQITSAVGMVVVFWYGGNLLLSHRLTEGGLLAFFRASARLTWPLIAFGYIVAIVQRGRAAYARLTEVFSAKPELSGTSEPSQPLAAERVELSAVTHRYGEREILRDVNLVVTRGERVAIVGPTGSGKSTLARILGRVIVPTEGSMTIDGQSVDDLALASVRRSICYSQQSPFLFSSTILQNIAFSLSYPDTPTSRNLAVEMGRAVRLEEEVQVLEHGYDTVVGERGIQLSGGQRQRVALARALLADSRLLILDDPTSAVDVETERGLIELLSKQRRELALVVVTHRISVAQECDRVLVLSEGKIVQSGKPEELAKVPGIYARFCEEQRLETEVTRLESAELAAEVHPSEPGSSKFDLSAKPGIAPDRRERALREFHEEHALGKAFDGRLLTRLVGYLSAERKWLILALFAVLGTAALALSRPMIVRVAMDQALSTHAVGALVTAGFLVAGLMLIEQILGFAQAYLTQLAGTRAMAGLRLRLFELLQRLPIAFFDRQPVGRLTTRVTNDIDAISELFASGILSAMGDLVRLVGIFAIMLWVDAKLGVAAFAALPIVVLLVLVMRRPMRDSFRDIRTRTARMNSALNEQVSGMSVVQAFEQVGRCEREFDKVNREYRDAHLRSIRYESMQDAGLETIASISLAAMVLVFGSSQSSFGTLLAFQLFLSQFFEPLSQLAQRYTLLQSAMAGAERVFGLLDEKGRDAPVSRDAAQAVAALSHPVHQLGDAPIHGHVPGLAKTIVQFSDVGFAYHPGQPVLKAINFAIQEGEHVALLGPTGSGKSTVLSLLLRMYEIEQGRIELEGRSIKTIEPAELRRLFAFVPQEPLLFPGTLLSNIAGANLEDRERARDVLAQIGALDHFERRLGGLTAPIVGLGQSLSMGERQLVAFARALYRDAPILLLDEATASIDSDTESRLQTALEATLAKRTAIVIAHRMGTIKTADRVLVLSRGRLVEQGTHQELLVHNGLYRKLVMLSTMRETGTVDA